MASFCLLPLYFRISFKTLLITLCLLTFSQGKMLISLKSHTQVFCNRLLVDFQIKAGNWILLHQSSPTLELLARSTQTHHLTINLQVPSENTLVQTFIFITIFKWLLVFVILCVELILSVPEFLVFVVSVVFLII